MTKIFAAYIPENYRDEMPPVSYHMRVWVGSWPWPFPPIVRATTWGHIKLDMVVDTAHRFHGEFRDRLEVPLLRAIGVPESTVTSFRDWNIQVQKTAYGRLRWALWFI